MENENKLGEIFDIPVTTKLKDDIRSAAVWAKLSAILSLAVGGVAFVRDAASGNVVQAIIVGLITALLGVFMYNFGNRTKRGIEESDQGDFEAGLESLRIYFKAYVIIIIATVSLVLLVAVYLISSFSR